MTKRPDLVLMNKKELVIERILIFQQTRKGKHILDLAREREKLRKVTVIQIIVGVYRPGKETGGTGD